MKSKNSFLNLCSRNTTTTSRMLWRMKKMSQIHFPKNEKTKASSKMKTRKTTTSFSATTAQTGYRWNTNLGISQTKVQAPETLLIFQRKERIRSQVSWFLPKTDQKRKISLLLLNFWWNAGNSSTKPNLATTVWRRTSSHPTLIHMWIPFFRKELNNLNLWNYKQLRKKIKYKNLNPFLTCWKK